MNPILNNLPNILGFIAITLFVFILIREVICWYFKVNEGIKLQEEMISNQQEIINLMLHEQKLTRKSKGVYIEEYQPRR